MSPDTPPEVSTLLRIFDSASGTVAAVLLIGYLLFKPLSTLPLGTVLLLAIAWLTLRFWYWRFLSQVPHLRRPTGM